MNDNIIFILIIVLGSIASIARGYFVNMPLKKNILITIVADLLLICFYIIYSLNKPEWVI